MTLSKTQRILNLLHFRAPLTTNEIAAALKEDPSITAGTIKSMSYKGRIVPDGKVESSKLKLWRPAEARPKTAFNPHSLPFSQIGSHAKKLKIPE